MLRGDSGHRVHEWQFSNRITDSFKIHNFLLSDIISVLYNTNDCV